MLEASSGGGEDNQFNGWRDKSLRLRSILVLLLVLLLVGGYFYFSNLPKPAPAKEPKLYVWLVEIDDLRHIEVRLPQEGKSQAFVLGDDRFWHFDDAQKSLVDIKRWGGGIPLLLSGPGADRVIARDATPEKLAEFGMANPRMGIKLVLKDNRVLDIVIGNETPNGNAFYVKAPDSNDVAIVDNSWYGVMERLVKDPPFATASSSPAAK